MSSAKNELVIDKAAVLGAASNLRTIQTAIGQLDFSLGLSGERLNLGAGEFKPEIEQTVFGFLLSWEQVFDICAESAAVIANGCTNFTANAFATDESLECSIT